MSVQRIRKNDVVTVVTGAHAGRTGKVLQVLAARNRALVEGVNLVKKAIRKTQDNPQGGIAEKEAALHVSNLMIHCPNCKVGVRIRVESDGDGRTRKCVKCGHAFDS